MMYFTPKNEYLAMMEECSKDAVEESTDCLPNNHKYLPKFITDYAKNLVSMMYDDFDIIVGKLKIEMIRLQY